MRPESPSEYLNKHIPKDETSNEEFFAAKEILSKPFGEITYQNEGGDVKIENPPFELEISYEPLTQEDKKPFQPHEPTPDTLMRLKTFTLSRRDKNISVQLFDIVPPDYNVYFDTTAADHSDIVYPDSKRIVLFGKLAAPKTILGLFHEGGHIIEQAKGEAEFGPEKHSTQLVDHLARQLLSERDAWAFALKKIKPFLDEEEGDQFTIQRDAVIEHIKNYALRTYTDSIKNSVESARATSHGYDDYMDMFNERFEDFGKDE